MCLRAEPSKQDSAFPGSPGKGGRRCRTRGTAPGSWRSGRRAPARSRTTVVEDGRLLVRRDPPPPVVVALDRREDVPGERVHAAVRRVRPEVRAGRAEAGARRDGQRAVGRPEALAGPGHGGVEEAPRRLGAGLPLAHRLPAALLPPGGRGPLPRGARRSLSAAARATRCTWAAWPGTYSWWTGPTGTGSEEGPENLNSMKEPGGFDAVIMVTVVCYSGYVALGVLLDITKRRRSIHSATHVSQLLR